MKRRYIRRCLSLGFASIAMLQVCATFVFAQTAQTYTFATVDVPLPDGRLGFTHLSDINDEGQIAGAFTNSNLGQYGFLLKAKKNLRPTEVRCTGKEQVRSTAPQSINSHGEISGFASVVVETIKIPQPPHKLFRTKISGFFRNRAGKCTIIDFPGANLTEAVGLNDAGQAVGDYRDSETGIFHGFLWDAGQFLTIDVPGARSTAPHGINNTGQIVGFYFDNNVTPEFPNGHIHGFLYDNGIFSSFARPDVAYAEPVDINDNGQIVGFDSTGQSFVFDNGTFTTFEVPLSGVLFTQVRGINNQGQIVGRFVMDNPNYPNDPSNPFLSHGFVASPNVNSPLVTRLTEGQPLDPKEPVAVRQAAIDDAENLATTRQSNRQLCIFDDVTPASSCLR